MRVELDAHEHAVLLASFRETASGAADAIRSVGGEWNERDLANTPGMGRLVEARDRLVEGPVLDAPRHDLEELLLAQRQGETFWLRESRKRGIQDADREEQVRVLLKVVDAVLVRVRAAPEPPTGRPPSRPRRPG